MKSSCLLYKEGIGMGRKEKTQKLPGGITEVNGKFSLTLNRDLSHSQLCKEARTSLTPIKLSSKRCLQKMNTVLIYPN